MVLRMQGRAVEEGCCAAAQEPVHKLAWTLDACLKDRVLDAGRLRELTHFLATCDRQAASQAALGRALRTHSQIASGAWQAVSAAAS